METEELGLTLTIGFVAISTSRTSSACVSRVYKKDGYSSHLCLVAYKVFQLVKSPITHLPSHFAAKTVGSLSYPCQVFEGKCLARRMCRLHKLFTDNVINVPGKTRSLAAHLFECAFCSFRPRLLQARTMGAGATAADFDRLPRILTAFAVGGNLHNAKVNPENAVRFDKGRVWDTHRRHQVEVAADKCKVGFTLTESEKPALIRSADKRQFKPAVNRPNADLPFVSVPRQDAVIKGDSPCRLKRALSALVEFVGVGHFGNGANDHLRGQARCPALGGVLPFVQGVLLKGLILPSPRADVVTDSVCGLHRSLQGVGLGRCHNQFYLCSKFHYTDIIPAITKGYRCLSHLLGQFLPRLKVKGVSWGLRHPASALPAYTKCLL